MTTKQMREQSERLRNLRLNEKTDTAQYAHLSIRKDLWALAAEICDRIERRGKTHTKRSKQ